MYIDYIYYDNEWVCVITEKLPIYIGDLSVVLCMVSFILQKCGIL